MAQLLECKDCKHRVSENAETCPNCGARLREKTSAGTGCLAVVVIGFGAALLFGALGKKNYEPSSSTPSPSTTRSSIDPAIIRQVQRSLKIVGYEAGPADGIIGPATREAIKRFQEDHDIPVTGKPDANLLLTLADAHEAVLNRLRPLVENQ